MSDKIDLELAYKMFPPFQGTHGHNFKDWSGIQQGFLTILYCAQEKKENRSAFVCLCECGKYTLISSASLRKGQQSCGCMSASIRRKKLQDDISNQTFGFLTAQKPDDSKPGYWICECTCGKYKSIARSSLIRGSSKSCGCKSKELNSLSHIKSVDIGTKIGKLTVTTNSFKKKDNDTHYYQTCVCDCGNSIDVRSSILASRQIQSCGCAKSKGELIIKTLLKEQNINFKQEYSFDDLYGDAYKLRFDFAIFNTNAQLCFLVEYNGAQHYEPQGGYFEGSFDKIADYDQRKIKYCESNNIPLIIIDYTKTEYEIREEINNALDRFQCRIS
jgi:hypothetical protein